MSPELEAALNLLPMTAVTIVTDALKQAHNEALEEAAKACRALMEGQSGGVLKNLEMAERDIRAMKR